jgi:hypothetical protein
MSNQFQTKLLEYAPEPPERVWNAIETALDEGSSTLSHKLYEFEATPPPQVWNKIDIELDKTARPAKLISFYRQHKKAMGYAAAAILFFITITSGYLMNRKTQSASLVTIPASSQHKQDNTPASYAIDPSQSTALYTQKSENKNDQGSFFEEKKTLLKRLRPQLKLGSWVFTNRFVPKVARTKQTVGEDASAEKYMIYSDGDGNALKLSKKLFDFFSCAKEELACRQQMQQLQQQFASTSLSTDFTSVLEMLQKLKENQ